MCELHCGFTCRAIAEHPIAKSVFEAGNLCIYGIMYEYDLFFIFFLHFIALQEVNYQEMVMHFIKVIKMYLILLL